MQSTADKGSQFTRKTLEAISLWGETNMQVLRQLLDCSASTAREGLNLSTELQTSVFEAAKQGQSYMLQRLSELPDAPKQPMDYYQKSLMAYVDTAEQVYKLSTYFRRVVLVECHLETGATAMARHTPYVTAVMARNLAHQGEAKAHSTIATFRHTGGTVERRKDTLAFLLWHARSTVGNAEAGAARVEGDDGCLDGRASRVALGILEQVAQKPTQHARVALDTDRGATDLCRTAGPLLGQQGEQIDLFGMLEVLQGIQTAGQQEFANQGVEFRDILREASLEFGALSVRQEFDGHTHAGER